MSDETVVGALWGIFFSLSLFLGIVAIGEALRWKIAAPVEFSRKFVHFSSGVIVAAFPWVFKSFVPVLAIAVIMSLFLVLSKKGNWFPSLHGVERETSGDIYYLLAILFLFLFADKYPVFYLISVLVLVVSDSLAAILGSTYQRITYRVEHQKKSLEGSAVFFLSTFLIVLLPLLLMTDMGREECVLVALLLAIIVTLLEAICIFGTDNLVVPVISFLALIESQHLTPDRLVGHLAWQMITLALVNLINWKWEFIGISGIIGAHLFLYGSFALGDPYWVVVPTAALTVFIIALGSLAKKLTSYTKNIYQVVAFFYVSLVPLVLLFAHNLFYWLLRYPPELSESSSFYLLFISAIAIHLSASLHSAFKNSFSYSLPILGSLAFFFLIPLGVFVMPGNFDFYRLALPALGMGAGLSVYYALQKRIKDQDRFPVNVRLQSAASAAGVIAALPWYLFHTGIFTR